MVPMINYPRQDEQQVLLAKQTRLLQIQTAVLIGILGVLLLFAAGAVWGFFELRRTLGALEETLRLMDMDTLNEAIGSLGKATDSLSKLDFGNLSDLIGSLNTIVSSLQTIVEGLARLFP